jgi:hypothetical protein
MSTRAKAVVAVGTAGVIAASTVVALKLTSGGGASPCSTATAVAVRATDNIFGAAAKTLPGGDGAGIRPVCVGIPGGSSKVMTVHATGRSSYDVGRSSVGTPAGDTSHTFVGGVISGVGGISGVDTVNRVGYLAGVFLANSQPPHAPPSLELHEHYDFTSLSPQLGQVFYIGDGVTASGVQQVFHIPPGATTLYLGLADASSFAGAPCCYQDNTGTFRATLSFS